MKDALPVKHLAIVGAGPSCLFLLNTLLNKKNAHCSIDIFEAAQTTGNGFPYSSEGSSYEHITNVSGNEIPELVNTTAEWLRTVPAATLHKYGIELSDFNDYRVFPRLLFGEYLHHQFQQLLEKAAHKKIAVQVHLNTRVTDIIDSKENAHIEIKTGNKSYTGFSDLIICSGHYWPKPHEHEQRGYYDSPYPPAKIARQYNHTIAIKGSSLTAIDAIRTLAQQNGRFFTDDSGKMLFTANEESGNFSIAMYSIGGLLPGIRFHLEDSHLSADSLLSEEELDCHRRENDGFLSLDFIFEKDFKEPLRKKDPAFYDRIKDMDMETFVDMVMKMRERAEPFALLRAEYEEARQSIKRHQSVHWKEMLATLSFAMNYPAKHFSAEDMQRLQQTLMPLISIIIAFVPQDSCDELFALHDAGRLSIIPVEKDSHIELDAVAGIIYHHTDPGGTAHAISYNTFIDCTGQPHLWIKDFPFKTLVEQGTVSQALLRFRSIEKARQAATKDPEKVIEEGDKHYYLKVPGIAISDSFNVIQQDKTANQHMYMMAVPFIGGFNPDYSGLDFCEEASGKIVEAIFK